MIYVKGEQGKEQKRLSRYATFQSKTGSSFEFTFYPLQTA